MVRKKEDPAKVRQRVADHSARQRAKGLTKVTVWIPTENAADVRSYAESLRNAASLDD